MSLITGWNRSQNSDFDYDFLELDTKVTSKFTFEETADIYHDP